ncbi:MAG TPA: hypothetical protein VGL13_06500, partial [Polyangiaceae bacterium]
KESDKDILDEKPLSVKTGRTLDEIAAHKRKAKSDRKAATKKTARKRKVKRQVKHKVKSKLRAKARR